MERATDLIFAAITWPWLLPVLVVAMVGVLWPRRGRLPSDYGRGAVVILALFTGYFCGEGIYLSFYFIIGAPVVIILSLIAAAGVFLAASKWGGFCAASRQKDGDPPVRDRTNEGRRLFLAVAVFLAIISLVWVLLAKAHFSISLAIPWLLMIGGGFLWWRLVNGPKEGTWKISLPRNRASPGGFLDAIFVGPIMVFGIILGVILCALVSEPPNAYNIFFRYGVWLVIPPSVFLAWSYYRLPAPVNWQRQIVGYAALTALFTLLMAGRLWHEAILLEDAVTSSVPAGATRVSALVVSSGTADNCERNARGKWEVQGNVAEAVAVVEASLRKQGWVGGWTMQSGYFKRPGHVGELHVVLANTTTSGEGESTQIVLEANTGCSTAPPDSKLGPYATPSP